MIGILQLTLVVILWNHAEGQLLKSSGKCVNFDNSDLHIPPNNSIVEGEEKGDGDDWYKHVNWLDTPAGDLTLLCNMEYWAQNDWHSFRQEALPLFSEGNTEWHDIAEFVRKALGLNHLRAKIPGKLRVPSTLFTNEKCWKIRFGRYFQDDLKFRISLDVVDDDNNKLLTGHVIIPSKKRIDS